MKYLFLEFIAVSFPAAVMVTYLPDMGVQVGSPIFITLIAVVCVVAGTAKAMWSVNKKNERN
jgi:hypothetical protein